MSTTLLSIVLALSSFIFLGCTFLEEKQPYITSDIDRFWQMSDSLRSAKRSEDSLQLIRSLYLDKMSTEGQKFIEVREYTASEYLRTIRRYPKYLKQLRSRTADIEMYKAELDTMFRKMQDVVPGYKIPRVCFAIGCFRGGGTTKKGVVLMGCEIALADTAMDVSEFKGNLKENLSKGTDLVSLVAHEGIHCQQYHGKNRSLLSIALQEGTANFLPILVLGKERNADVTAYQRDHECELWKEFKPEVDSEDISKWFFNTGSIQNRPPDLGYFIGTQICEAYYDRRTDKKDAIRKLLDRSLYMEVTEQSGYDGNCSK